VPRSSSSDSSAIFWELAQIEVMHFQPASRGIVATTGLVVVITGLALTLVYLLGR
jgi:hypothetical protein